MGQGGIFEGVCFGFQFASTFRLDFLRSGSGPTIEVTEGPVPIPTAPPLAEWPELIGQRSYAALHQGDDGAYQIVIGRMGRFRVEPGTGRIVADLDSTLPPASKEGLLLATPAALCITARGSLAIHAGSVDLGGVAVLLAATGSQGKTTLTAAFHRAGYRALADDLTACTVSPATVLPGPALLRMREDSAAVLQIEDVQAVMTRAGKVHYRISEHRRGSGDPIRLGGIVFLEWAGEPSLESIPSPEAISRLWKLSFFLPGDYERRICFEGLVDLVERAPTWVLRRSRNYEGLEQTVKLLAARVRGPGT